MSGLNVLKELEPLDIHTGYTADIYGAFAQHAQDKFVTLTPADVTDLWETWSINNINEDGTFKEIFSLPSLEAPSNKVYESLGLTKDRVHEIDGIVNEIIDAPKFNPEGPDTVQIMSEAAPHLRSHAEIVWLGYIIGTAGAKNKAEEGPIGKMITISLGGKEPKISVKDI